MAAADVQPPGPHLDFAELERQLAKKATFESATRALAAAPPEALAAAAARKCLARCRTLLKARYTSRPFWVAGRQLFQSAVPAAEASGDAAWVQQLQVRRRRCRGCCRGRQAGHDSCL